LNLLQLSTQKAKLAASMKKLVIAILILILLLLIGTAWFVGNSLTAPSQVSVGNCPNDLMCENVEFSSESGATIKGWFIKGEEGSGAVVIMHGLRSNRLQLVVRKLNF
jgi:uncharacterized protein